MIGPQRVSLLDGDVVHREYSRRAALDQFLERVVDAIAFRIQDSTALSVSSAVPAVTTANVSSPRWQVNRSWSFQGKTDAVKTMINEKLCSWLLNASPNGEKSNPLELGWSVPPLSQPFIEVTAENDADLAFDWVDDDEYPNECGYAIMTC